MDQDGDRFNSPSEMLISPRWGFLLTTLLLVNLSLVAWAAAFVPDPPETAMLQSQGSLPADAGPPSAPKAAAPRSETNSERTARHRSALSTPTIMPAEPAASGPESGTDSDEAALAPAISVEWAAEPREPQSADADRPEPVAVETGTSQTLDPQNQTAGEPAGDVSPSPEQTQASEVPAGLVIINPPTTGGEVHFLLEDEVVSLQPGEFHVVAEIDERVVKFDRGEDFGFVEQKVSDEAWVFAVGPRGWRFQLVDRTAAAEHLQRCRPRSSKPLEAAAQP
jgi:hypothetical protein